MQIANESSCIYYLNLSSKNKGINAVSISSRAITQCFPLEYDNLQPEYTSKFWILIFFQNYILQNIFLFLNMYAKYFLPEPEYNNIHENF